VGVFVSFRLIVTVVLVAMSIAFAGPPSSGTWKVLPELTDEFNGNQLDETKWFDHNPGWQGRKPGFFLASNVRVSDGKLNLTARAQNLSDLPAGYHSFTTAAVKAKTLVKYGYFEVKCRSMHSRASSAFWFYHSTPEQWTEIDVFEIGGAAPKHRRTYHTNVHVFHTPEEKRHWSKSGQWQAPYDLSQETHIYGLNWDRDEIAWSVDGQVIRRVVNTHWHQALHMNFDSETMPEWFGLPDPNELPATFGIDHVRSWQREDDEGFYPDPQRFEKAIQAFESQDKKTPPPTNAVVCVGSSSMRGWHGTIHEDLSPVPVIPRGFGGSNMKDALHYAERIVLAYKPRAVVVYEGDNDAAQGIGPEKILRTFQAFTETIHQQLPKTRIYFLAIKPSIKRWAMWPAMQQANTLIAEACTNDGRLTYVDIATPMLNAQGQPKKDIFKSDDLHMNEKGYVIWKDVLRPILHEKEL
jgi:beta-glucanase (GH16 family)/lysophospholipase L1-like esterase